MERTTRRDFIGTLVRKERLRVGIPPLTDEKGKIVKTDMEKVEISSLPQPSLPVKLPMFLVSLNLKAGAGGAKPLPL